MANQTEHALFAQLGLRLPIIQAPMAGVSTPQLAAAVSNAGGLGSLGIAAMKVEDAAKSIETTSRFTTQPFQVNVFCHKSPSVSKQQHDAWLTYLAPYFSEAGGEVPLELELPYQTFDETPGMTEMLLDLRPAVISFHFGLPAEAAVRTFRGAGIRLLATATCVREAEAIALAGMDAIVAQGYEAGGHRGTFDDSVRDEKFSTAVLVRTLSLRFPLPIIAAGGIMDGTGIAAALCGGAACAQLGTAFVACPESGADAAYRAALLNGAATGTTMTRAISGRFARGLANRFSMLGEDPACPVVPEYPLTYSAGKALAAAAKRSGLDGFDAHWAGQGVAEIRVLPAAELMALLASETEEAKMRFTSNTYSYVGQ
jgi:nitronate monooxygenase